MIPQVNYAPHVGREPHVRRSVVLVSSDQYRVRHREQADEGRLF